MTEFGSIVLGRSDFKTYRSILCPKCSEPMKIVSKNYYFDKYNVKRFPEKEILLFNICEKCGLSKPIVEGQELQAGPQEG